MKSYTVILAFNRSMSEVCLLRKKKGAVCYEGCWNGCGGHIEESETPLECAVRELHEELGLTKRPEEMLCIGMQQVFNFADDSEEGVNGYLLYWFMTIDEGKEAKQCENEPIFWWPVERVLMDTVNADLFAGNGNLQYYIKQALIAIKEARRKYR